MNNEKYFPTSQHLRPLLTMWMRNLLAPSPLLIEDEDQTQRVEPVTDDPKMKTMFRHTSPVPKMEDEEQTTDTPAEHHDQMVNNATTITIPHNNHHNSRRT